VDRSALGWNQACLSSYINYALNTRTRARTCVPTRCTRGWRGGEGESFCPAAVASCRRAIEIVDCGTRLRARPQDATAVLLSSLSLSLSLSDPNSSSALRAERSLLLERRFLSDAESFWIFRISFSITTSRRTRVSISLMASLIIRSGCLVDCPAVAYSRAGAPAATSKSEKPLRAASAFRTRGRERIFERNASRGADRLADRLGLIADKATRSSRLRSCLHRRTGQLLTNYCETRTDEAFESWRCRETRSRADHRLRPRNHRCSRVNIAQRC